jgi:indole-3-glycerol phosphate synthase
MDVLEKIIASKRTELESEKRQMPMRRAIELASSAPPPHPFGAALRHAGRLSVIAEVKRASPSRGVIRRGAEPAEVARAYAKAGAAAVSVLTDERFFLGSPRHLEQVRAAVDLPLLRKDFLFDEYQIYRSRAHGADAILLIARILEPRLMKTLLGVALSLHMEALVEVHDEDELRRALECGATMIGVNNRDLGSLSVSIETSLRLAPLLPETVVRVSESGIESRADLQRLRSAGYDAFLIGERLMREEDPGAALAALLAGGDA